MNKKGFTLIELLAAIIVLGIVSLVVFPTVDKTIRNQKRKLYDRQVDTIISAANSWASKNTVYLPDLSASAVGDKVYVGVDTLSANGFLESGDITDPRISDENNSKINGCVIIRYDSDNHQYVYNFINLAETTDANCDTENINVIKSGVSELLCTTVSDSIVCD